MPVDLLPFSAPAALMLSAAAGVLGPRRRPPIVSRAAEASALVAIFVTVISAAALIARGPFDGRVIGLHGVGLSIRFDVVSGTMLLLVSFIGWVVVRYAATYLDGETRQGAFTGWLCMTLASVLLLVMSGNLVQLVLAWIATSLFLHRLLLFYPDRIGARRAAAKKFVTARLGDASLVCAAVLLTQAYGSSNIAVILSAARAGGGGSLAIAAAGSWERPRC